RRRGAVLHRGRSPVDLRGDHDRRRLRARRGDAVTRHRHAAALGRSEKPLRRQPRRQAISVHVAGRRRSFGAVHRRCELDTYNVAVNSAGGTLANPATPQPRERISAAGWRIVLLASLGGTLEFYDFVIFGIFAKDIADAIFPNQSPLVSLMASFGAFAAGYLARPIGGIVLSHFGDRYGRRRVFLVSIFVMSGATLGMGLVPSFATWVPAASALMVVLRLVQGFCLGGE